MSRLGDFIKKEDKKQLLLPNGIEVGTVIKSHVSFTNPPKEKRLIVVGFNQNKVHLAAVLINSEINTLINFNRTMQSHHLLLKSDGREYLDKDSFVDCTELFPLEKDSIELKINERPEIIIGRVQKEDLDMIIQRIIDSELIKGKIKKKSGIYDYVF